MEWLNHLGTNKRQQWSDSGPVENHVGGNALCSHNWIGTFLSVTMDNHDSEGPSILFSEFNRYNKTFKIDWNWKALSWRHDSQFPVSNSNASNVQSVCLCALITWQWAPNIPKQKSKRHWIKGLRRGRRWSIVSPQIPTQLMYKKSYRNSPNVERKNTKKFGNHVKTVVESYFVKLNFCKWNSLKKHSTYIKM